MLQTQQTLPNSTSINGQLKLTKLAITTIVLCIMVVPIAVVLREGMTLNLESWQEVIYRPFVYATQRSFKLLFWLTLVGSLVGGLLGCVASLWKFPLKSISLVFLSLSLVVPSFVSAIGIQSLQAFFSFSKSDLLDGYFGCFWSGLVIVLPLVILGSFVAGLQISKSEREMIMVYRGRGVMLLRAWLRLFPVAIVCALFGAILFLSDSGSSQIMGYHGISADVRVSFSAKNDFKAASMKAIVLMILFIPIVIVLLLFYKKKLNGSILLTRQTLKDLPELRFVSSVVLGGIYFLICILPVMAIFTGLVNPLLAPVSQPYIDSALKLFLDSVWTTLFYGLGGALFALVCASALRVCVREKRQWIIVAVCVMLLVIPSCVFSLGILKIGSSASVGLDWLFRSELAVVAGMGLIYTPLCYLLLYAIAKPMPQSSIEATRMYELSMWQKIRSIYVPYYSGQIVTCFIVTSLILLADVSSMSLLQPPGGSSFGSHLFAVMDAASERVVAALCLIYVAIPVVITLLYATYKLIKNR